MTEKNQALLSTVFSPQPKGTSRNSALVSEHSRATQSDNTFSRELSRATQQSQSTRSTESASRQDGAGSSRNRFDNRDPSASRSGESISKQTQAQINESSSQSESKSVVPASATSTEINSQKTNSDPVMHENTQASQLVSEMPGNTQASQLDSEMPEYIQASQLDSEMDDGVDEINQAALQLLEETDAAISVGLDDQPEVVSAMFGDSQIEQAATNAVAASGSEADEAKLASATLNSLQTDTGKVTVTSNAQLTGLDMATELMPAQLHARQLQLINASEASQVEETVSVIALSNAQKAKSTTSPPIAVTAQASSAALLAGMSKAQIEGQTSSTAAVPQAIPGQVTQTPEHANPMATLSAQHSLNLSDTLPEAKLQAQQVAEQKQMLEVDQARIRQIALQQALAPSGATVQETGDSTTDNMFHSVLGGTVTPAVSQRPDGGNVQLTNAPMNVSILHSDADKAMAGNIRWMVNENVKQAVVNVTPSGMGPISVSIGLENDQMNVSIVATQGSTREALDSMLPRLREQLVAQGHDGVKVDISDGRSENSGNGFDRHAANPEQGDGAEQESENPSSLMEQTLKNENSTAETVAINDKEGFLLVDRNGQLRGGYDVYV